MSVRAAIALKHGSLRSIDSIRLCQLADRLRVSTDWLVGRTSERYLLARPEIPDVLGGAFPVISKETKHVN